MHNPLLRPQLIAQWATPVAGNTFCTIITYKEVIQAVGECAFSTSDLPVMLSLEVCRRGSNSTLYGAG